MNNPFVEGPVPSSWFRPYHSEPRRRVVWVKGGAAKAAPLGKFRCPIPAFDHVAFVVMEPRVLELSLPSSLFSTKERLSVDVSVRVTATVIESDAALVRIVTGFEAVLSVMSTDVTAVVGDFCRSRSADELLGAESALAELIGADLSAPNRFPVVTVNRVVVQIRSQLLEELALNTTKEHQEIALFEVRAAKGLAELAATIKREELRIKSECDAALAQATSTAQAESIRLKYVSEATALTETSKTAIFHLNPDVYQTIRLAEISQSREAEQEAMARVLGILRSVTDAIHSQGPTISNVFSGTAPGPDKKDGAQ